MTADQLARVCYEANRAYSAVIGEEEPPSWEVAPLEERNAWRWTVEFGFSNPPLTMELEKLHDYWMAVEKDLGWSYGPLLDDSSRKHPNHVAWRKLPIEQKRKIMMKSPATIKLTPDERERARQALAEVFRKMTPEEKTAMIEDVAHSTSRAIGNLLGQTYRQIEGQWWLISQGKPVRTLRADEIQGHTARGHSPFVAGGITSDDPRWFDDPKKTSELLANGAKCDV